MERVAWGKGVMPRFKVAFSWPLAGIWKDFEYVKAEIIYEVK